MSTLFQEFTQIVSALNERGIDYAVCGGWAMAIHGYPRGTIDIDVLLLSEDLNRVWQLVKDFGYDVEGLPLSFENGAIEIRRLSKIDKESRKLFTVDFLLVTDRLKQVWNERQDIMVRDMKIRTVSKEGLIFLKTLAGRKQDLADIERLSDES